MTRISRSPAVLMQRGGPDVSEFSPQRRNLGTVSTGLVADAYGAVRDAVTFGRDVASPDEG